LLVYVKLTLQLKEKTIMLPKNTICPRCETVLSQDETRALDAKHKRGGLIGLTLGLIGAAAGTAFGLYFSFAG
jgi:hypothetical protein